MTWTVVVPSRNDAAVVDFVGSLLSAHPDMTPDQIIIVDDGLSDHTRDILSDLTFIEGVKPFVFARAVNMGVAAEPDNDIVIAGDDVRFLTAGILDTLADQSAGVAAISPEIIGAGGNPAQRAGSNATTAEWLAFVCAYIPRAAWNAVGPLDERFIGYGFDDVDWCLRAAEYGPLRIDHDQRIAHLDISTFRSDPNWTDLYVENQGIFKDKWGDVAA